MPPGKVNIEASWKKLLASEFEQPYFEELSNYLTKAKQEGKVIYPPGKMIFNAFQLTPVNNLKVVILGQDPYHGPGEAMGLSFSVPPEVRIPPSLKNIYKEINRDLGLPIPSSGDLTKWAKQGVLLLNAILTVEHKQAGSHSKIGWHHFTDAVIAQISEHLEGIVFLLWGNFAKSKKDLIDTTRHQVLTAAHPSPLARNAFNNCKHFSKTNEILRNSGQKEIDWSLD